MTVSSGICCPSCGNTLFQRRPGEDGTHAQGITRAESRVLEVFVRAALARQLTPTYVEIAHAVQMKTRSNVHRCVVALLAKGMLERGDNEHPQTHHRARARDLVLTPRAWRLYGIAAPEAPHA
jgi:hypothetical protein